MATDGNGRVARTYQLVIDVRRTVSVEIGRFGRFVFPAGYYVYTGSAKRNFDARVRRHLAREKTLRWHIDYLLATPGVSIVEVWCYDEDECAVNRRTPGEIPVAGFGASDCAAGCGSHLKRIGAT